MENKKSQLEFTPELLELYGTVMGDGCLVKHLPKDRQTPRKIVFITGNAESDEEYLVDYIKPMIQRNFGGKPYVRFRRESKTIDLYIHNKPLFEWLEINGFPVGLKGEISIPEKFIQMGFAGVKEIMRGIFDTDGCLSARKSEGYKDPFVLISTKSNTLREQLKQILRAQGYPAYNSGHMVGIKGGKHAKRWFSEIGSSNPRNLKRFQAWLDTGTLPMVANK